MKNSLSKEKITSGIFKAMNSRDFSGIEPFIADTIEFDFPGAGCMAGKKRVLIFLKALLRKYPELVFSVSEIIIESERACAIWSNKGRDSNGHAYENRGVTYIRFADDTIVYLSDYFKDTSFTLVKS